MDSYDEDDNYSFAMLSMGHENVSLARYEGLKVVLNG